MCRGGQARRLTILLKFMAWPYFILMMIILHLVGFHFMKILGAKLTFVYYAHIGIMGLAEAMRIEDEEEEAGVKPELAL